jgi:hypothetical protein
MVEEESRAHAEAGRVILGPWSPETSFLGAQTPAARNAVRGKHSAIPVSAALNTQRSTDDFCSVALS